MSHRSRGVQPSTPERQRFAEALGREARLDDGSIVVLNALGSGRRVRVWFAPGIDRPPGSAGHVRTVSFDRVTEILKESRPSG